MPRRPSLAVRGVAAPSRARLKRSTCSKASPCPGGENPSSPTITGEDRSNPASALPLREKQWKRDRLVGARTPDHQCPPAAVREAPECERRSPWSPALGG